MYFLTFSNPAALKRGPCVRVLVPLLTLPWFCACGSQQLGSTTPPIVASPLVLEQAPEVSVHGPFHAESAGNSGETLPVIYFSGSCCEDCMGFGCPDWEDQETEVSLGVPGVGVLWAEMWTVNGSTYLVVVVLGQDDTSSLYRFHDATGDGIPDASTGTLLVSSSPNEAFWTSVTQRSGFDGSEGTVAVLDRRCQDIYLIEDQNQDGWPDTLKSQPFAMSQQHADLLSVRQLYLLPDHTRYSLAATWVTVGVKPEQLFQFPGIRLNDTTGDGEADVVEPLPMISRTPRSRGTPYAGQTTLTVYGDLGPPNRVVEVWAVDSSAARTDLLGSTNLGSASSVAVTLSRALVLDETVALAFDSEGVDQQRVHTVWGAWPQILSVSPSRVSAVQAASPFTLTVQGLNLGSGMDVWMRELDYDVVELSYTLVSDTEATVTVPAQDAGEAPGTVGIWAVAVGQTEEDGAAVASVAVSAPE